MYSSAFCRVYNEFGWNYFPEAFGEQLIEWLRLNNFKPETSLDLGCGTGVLCRLLHDHGIRAHGMDLSEGMIAIARENSPEIEYEVADMIRYRPLRSFDLVTCTGDAINHIVRQEDILTIFRNVCAYLSSGGYFIFDLLNEGEVPDEEPIDFDFDETVRAQFSVERKANTVHLKVAVYENDAFKFEEVITETVHDPQMICDLLHQAGFADVQRSDRLIPDTDVQSTTWFIIARKQ